MKNVSAVALPMLLLAGSCDLLLPPDSRQGMIRVQFEETSVPETKSTTLDTNDFLLTVSDSKGNSLYNGTYGASPETILADPGTYTVTAVSCEFDAPAFDCPQYGDTEVVSVKSGETSTATLVCTQLNCGVRLKIDSGFLTEYPNAVLYLKSATGKLMYSYSEKRIAYFQPGTISVVMSEGSTDKTIFSKSLAAQQMLSLGISVSSSSTTSSSIQVQVDTTRTWLEDTYIIGGSTGGSSTSSAMSVAQARENAGKTDVWVYGYIVGGDLSSTKCSFTAPFSSRTNLVLATKSSCTDKSICLSVQLAKGDIRDALNLVDHESYLGMQIYLKGDIVEAYYGIPGLQNLSEYEFK